MGKNILIITGTQKFPFDRLLEAADGLAAPGGVLFSDTVEAQSGTGTYVPKHYKCVPFFSPEEMEEKINWADLVITHGGTGSIISAVIKGKKVIAVPRLSVYGEHVDDHQKELISTFAEAGYILKALNTDELEKEIKASDRFRPAKWSGGGDGLIRAVEAEIRKAPCRQKHR